MLTDIEKAISSENPSSCHKRKKRKRHQKDRITEAKHDCLQESFSVNDTLKEPPVTICTKSMPANMDATTLEPLTNATSEKKKRRDRRRRSDTDILEMTTMDHESTLLVPKKVEATNLEPAAKVTPGGKKKKKKTKKSDNVKRTIDNESNLLVPRQAEAIAEAVNLDLTADVTPGEKRKKKKAKRSDKLEMANVHNVSTLLVTTGAEAANLDFIANVTPGEKKKKKKKKKTKRSDNLEMATVDSERTLLVTTKAEATMEAANLDPAANVTPGEKKKKKKKKKTKRSDNLEMTTVDNGSTLFVSMETEANSEATNLEPTANVTAGEKKRKKKAKRNDNLEMTIVDNESALFIPTKEEAINLEPAAHVISEKKKRKGKRERSDNLEMTTADNESTLLGNSATEGLEYLEPVISTDAETNAENKYSESRGYSKSLVCQELVPTSEKGRKKKCKSQNPKISDLDHEKQNGAALETVAIERNVPLESAVSSEGATSENPTASANLSCSDKKKRKKKKKNKQGEVDNAHETNYKVSESVDITVTKNVVLDKIESVQPSVKDSIGGERVAEQLYPESSLSMEKGKYKEPIKKHKASDIPDVDYANALHQNIGTPRQGVADTKELEKDYKNLVGEVAGLNLADIKENSLTIEENYGLSNGVKATSISKSDDGAGVNHVLESKKIKTDKCSDSGDLRHDDDGDSLSHCLMEATTSGLLENKFETSSSQVDCVSKQVVDLLADKDCVNRSDIEPKGDLHLDATSNEGNLSQVPEILPERTLVSRSRKKLLILDVNGILVDFVNYAPKLYTADIMVSKKYVFKRPYCDEFLQFCFERFNVGVWSSRMKKNMEKVINFLFWDSKEKLFLCWDQSHCTMTGFNTLENQSKPLVLKELRNVWEKVEPDLPFEKGEYDETNTLLLDDSPYKALRNPANTAIFPNSYSYTDREDKSLGPGGTLRIYLERLSLADNVQKFIEQNPFGQPAITESHGSWSFYSKIVDTKETSSKL